MKIGINGLGRIGRMFLRAVIDRGNIEVVHINELCDNKTIAHLLKYDSVHGRLKASVDFNEEGILINGKFIAVTHQKDVTAIGWNTSNAELIIECTGLFLDTASAGLHFKSGAKKVLLSAPPKGADIKSVVLGINDDIITAEDTLISNASCTTNCAAPMIKVLDDLWEVQSAYISTIHSYTGDQRLLDSPHKDLRRARAAALSIIPTTTGAAKAITKIFPKLEGQIGGGGIRVPVPDGSLTDITVILKKNVTAEEVNEAFKAAANGNLKNIIEYTEDPIVSCDVVGNPSSVVFDAMLTSVVGPMVKIVGWYDNEVGYSNRLYELAVKVAAF